MELQQPPVAKTQPHERVQHGDHVQDPYYWFLDKEDKDVLGYLEAENTFTAAATEGQAALRERIFQEIKGRTKETDLSVPTRKGDWWHYARTEEGKQYSIHCRVAVTGPNARLSPTSTAVGVRGAMRVPLTRVPFFDPRSVTRSRPPPLATSA